MSVQSYHAVPAAVNPAPIMGPKIYPNGQPLTERAGASTILAENAYAFEFTAQTGEDVFGCYKVVIKNGATTFVQEYALDAVADIVTACNCPDTKCRKRTCKHMVELAVVLGTGLRTTRGGHLVLAANTLPEVLSGPKTVADAIKAMRVDYHAAAAKAVILTAALVEEAENPPARRVVSGFDPSDWK